MLGDMISWGAGVLAQCGTGVRGSPNPVVLVYQGAVGLGVQSIGLGFRH